MKNVSLFLMIAALFLSACGGCSDPIGENDFFDPPTFGEYEFDGEPNIDAPDRLLFGDVSVGSEKGERISITNTGRETLKISNWEISDEFELAFAIGQEEPDEIAPGQRVDVTVVFRSFNDREVRGLLVISSNDPDTPQHEIGLYANAKLPCLIVEPMDVDFGEVDPGESSQRTINVSSCSPNAVTRFEFGDVDGSARIFRFLEGQFEPRTVTDLEPGQSVEITYVFLPADAGREYQSEIPVTSNDEFEPERRVQLRGEGTESRCPSPIIDATIVNGASLTADPSATLSAIPLDTIRFDGRPSQAFQGRELVRWEWSLVSRPQDSSARFAMDEDENQNELFLDLAGRYEVNLVVWDSDDIRSCNAARLIIEATADEDVHIQLVWDTPADPDQLDSSGSDLDLHMLHEFGNWNEEPYDCFWQNLSPDWASSRQGFCNSPTEPGCQDDPSLDIDDVDGWGPENINLDNPEVATQYSVGVHYFSDHGYGMSFATVRVYIGGVLQAEFERQNLTDQGFWYVADIDWPSGAVTPVGSVFGSFPTN